MPNYFYTDPKADALDLEYKVSARARKKLLPTDSALNPREAINQILRLQNKGFAGTRSLSAREILQWNAATPGNEEVRSKRVIFYWYKDAAGVFHLRMVNPWQKLLPAAENFSLSVREFEWLRKKSIISSRLDIHWLAQPLTSATGDSLWLTFGHVIDDSAALHGSLHYLLPGVVSIIAGLAQYYFLRLRYKRSFGHEPDRITTKELKRKSAGMAFVSACASFGWMAGFLIGKIVVLALGFTPHGLLVHVILALAAATVQSLVTVGVTLLKEHRNGGITSKPKDLLLLGLSSFASAMVWYGFTLISVPVPWIKYTIASVVSFIASAIVYSLFSVPHKIFENLTHAVYSPPVRFFSSNSHGQGTPVQVQATAYSSGFFGGVSLKNKSADLAVNLSTHSEPEQDYVPDLPQTPLVYSRELFFGR